MIDTYPYLQKELYLWGWFIALPRMIPFIGQEKKTICLQFLQVRTGTRVFSVFSKVMVACKRESPSLPFQNAAGFFWIFLISLAITHQLRKLHCTATICSTHCLSVCKSVAAIFSHSPRISQPGTKV